MNSHNSEVPTKKSGSTKIRKRWILLGALLLVSLGIYLLPSSWERNGCTNPCSTDWLLKVWLPKLRQSKLIVFTLKISKIFAARRGPTADP